MSSKLSINEYAESIKETMPPLVIHEPSETLYSYNGKYFEPLTEFYLKRFIANYFVIQGYPDNWTPSLSQQIAEGIKMLPSLELIQAFDDNPNFINMNNGVYNLTTHKLSPHDSSYNFSTIIDVDYNPDAPTPENFNRFLETTFTLTPQEGSEETYFTPDYDAIDSVIQLGGYALYPQNKIEGLFMFMGSGSNGKSLLIQILSSFFPDKFITDMSLRILSKESSFDREPLIDSRLNISGEEKGKPMDAEQIKKITSGQAVMVARKFKTPYRLIPNTLLVMDSNTIPQFRDHTHGTMRRMYFFKFKNEFTPQKDYDKATPEQRENKRLFPMINRDTFLPNILAERSGIFNLFIDGLNKLKENDWNFPRSENSEEMMADYMEETDTLGTWLTENYREGTKKTPIDDYSSILEILTKFQLYYQEHFPGTRFPYSSKGISRKINSIWGLTRMQRSVKIDQEWENVSAYNIQPINKEPPIIF